MMSNIIRDLDDMPAFVAQMLAHDEQTRIDALTPGFPPTKAAARRLPATLAHAIRFTTFESLCLHGGLPDHDAIDVLIAAVLTSTNDHTP